MKVTNTETFIKKAKSVHGDQYDYSETVYTKTRDKVIFKCNHCGEEIEQFAYDHIRVRKSGRFTNVNGGCKNCRIEKLRKDRSHSLESLKSKISECFDTTTYKLDLLTEENMNDELIPFICPLHDKVFYSRKRSTDKSYSVKTPCKFCNNTFKTLCKQLKVEENTHSNIIEMAKETFCISYSIICFSLVILGFKYVILRYGSYSSLIILPLKKPSSGVKNLKLLIVLLF